MAERSIVVIGLPESGKTTFLAALWHVITASEVETKLKFATLRAGNAAHLNSIATLWRQARRQERTSVSESRVVSMSLRTADGTLDTVSFPDVAGEKFRQMWEERECDPGIADLLKSEGVLFFIHADQIDSAGWVNDEKLQCEVLGIPYSPGQVVPWSPRLAPTQVQVVDLLQTLQEPPLDVGARRLAIVLSAWDKAAPEGLSPRQYLAQKMPLLSQFLGANLSKTWEVRVYGVSAQGGDYDGEGEKVESAEELRNLDVPSERIVVVHEGQVSHDVTEPLHWLFG